MHPVNDAVFHHGPYSSSRILSISFLIAFRYTLFSASLMCSPTNQRYFYSLVVAVRKFFTFVSFTVVRHPILTTISTAMKHLAVVIWPFPAYRLSTDTTTFRMLYYALSLPIPTVNNWRLRKKALTFWEESAVAGSRPSVRTAARSWCVCVRMQRGIAAAVKETELLARQTVIGFLPKLSADCRCCVALFESFADTTPGKVARKRIFHI